MADEDGNSSELRVELTVFQSKESYVYQIPPAATAGHRAETWNVDHWLQEVSVAVVTSGEECFVRLLDAKSGDLFAECPIPTSAPLITAVEPVVDSSRYFVLRVVDRQTGRHAFIGLGFRERMQASDFNAALHEHLRYLQRMRLAVEQRAAYAAAEQRRSTEGASISDHSDVQYPKTDFALKPGETITLKMGKDRSGPASRGVKLAGTVSALSPMSPVPGLAIPQLQPPGSNSQIPVLSPPPAKLASRSSAAAASPATPDLSGLRVSGEFSRLHSNAETAPASSSSPNSTAPKQHEASAPGILDSQSASPTAEAKLASEPPDDDADDWGTFVS